MMHLLFLQRFNVPDDCNKHETNGRTFQLMLNSFTENHFKYFWVVKIFWRKLNYRNKLELEFFLMNAVELQQLIFILLLAIGVARIFD